MDIDARIDALSSALVGSGVEAPRPPDDLSVLGELDAAIAPLRLPAEVRRFWERVDPRTLAADPYPAPTEPDFALHSWRQARELFASMQPAILLLVGYSSHQCMSVELHSRSVQGGALFEWTLVDGGFELRFHCLGDWIAHITALIEQGSFERREGPTGVRLLVEDRERELPLVDRRPVTLPAHRVHGDAKSVPRDILQWPAHWQRASGLAAEDIEPRGATHSIRELLASDPAAPFEATIAGTVTSLASFGPGTRVRVTDGTATIDINCPAATTLLGPGLRGEFEFDVQITAGERMAPEDPEAASAGVKDAVQRLTKILMARHGGPVGATATAVRRLN